MAVLTKVADHVLVHESEFLQSNAVAVVGGDGVLVIDPGIDRDEMAALAGDIRGLGQAVVAGFSTHPHWDHVLWDAGLGAPPRYGTARCAADLRDFLAGENWEDQLAEMLPPELIGQVPIDLLGRITGLPENTAEIPWDGPRVRIIEHQAHAVEHAALVAEESRVLVAGDMLSDTLIPFLDLAADHPIDDYLAALGLLEAVSDEIDVVIPGHGSVGDGAELRRRIDQDRSYVQALREADDPGDPRLEPSAPHGSWLPGVHDWQRQQLARTGERPSG